MGRKRRDQEQAPKQATRDDEAANDRRPRRGRKLALLLALAGAAVYLVRRNQRKAALDEGIWHEAPPPATSTAPASAPTA
jgi:ferric-dicitrate binding protein FerR (iron transport regulator)